MKKLLFLLFLSSVSFAVSAQKFGYIDSEYITSKMSDYKKVEADMDAYSAKWVKDIQDKYAEFEKLKQQFQQEEVLLTADMKRERQKAINDKESEVKELNNKIFGLNGLLFQKKKELMRPIMDEIYKSCEKVARQKQLMFIFDKASDISMIYTDPRHDYTDYVIEALGLNAKEDLKKELIKAIPKTQEILNNQVNKPKK